MLFSLPHSGNLTKDAVLSMPIILAFGKMALYMTIRFPGLHPKSVTLYTQKIGPMRYISHRAYFYVRVNDV